MYEVFVFDGMNYRYHTSNETTWAIPEPITAESIEWGVRVWDAFGNTGPWQRGTVIFDSVIQGLSAYVSPSSRPTSFQWIPIQGAEVYELLVQNAAGEVLRDRTITEPEFTVESEFAVGDYRAWVRALGAGNVVGSWSPMITFRVG